MKHKLQVKIVLFIAVYFTLTSSVLAALDVNPNLPITHSVFVQPIIVSDNNGSNTANFFGAPNIQLQLEGLVDNIWAQAGIDVDFLPANSWDNSFANSGNILPRPNTDLNTIVSDATTAGKTNPDSTVINMFFVNIPAGFDQLNTNVAAGLAILNGNGITQYVGSDLLTFLTGLETIAAVVAHEIGHNLGLDHSNTLGFSDGRSNLMWSGGRIGERLSSEQISLALGSDFSVTAVPVPAAVWLFGSALLTLFGYTPRMQKKVVTS